MPYTNAENVEMICDRYSIPLCANIDDFIALIKEEF